MSVEGMWLFTSGSHVDPMQIEHGTVVILETGRVFGGDAFTAFTGSYDVGGGKLRAQVRSWRWNAAGGDDVYNVFGMGGMFDYEVTVDAEIQGDDLIVGWIEPTGQPEDRLPAIMRKAAELPG